MSDKNQVFEIVKQRVIETLGSDDEQVTMEAKLREDLGADLLDNVELIMDIENEFSITVPDEKAEAVETVGDIVDLVISLSS